MAKAEKEKKERDFTNEIYAYALDNAILHEKAMVSAVLPKLFQHGLEKERIKDIMPEINRVVNEINSFSPDVKAKLFEEYSKYIKEKKEDVKGLKDLPGVVSGKKGQKMIFRLAPFPSGGLHIGNTKTYLLNALYAEKYKAKTFLVIDDTIGSEEKAITPDAYKLIPDAFRWLKVEFKKPTIYKSDRLKIYYKYAEELLKKGNAYVCGCSQEELRKNRVEMRECSCREFPVKIQMERWTIMFRSNPRQYVLRLKTNMQHPNPAFRDRVLCRISTRRHPRVGNKYRVWPMLEFSWAIDDHLLGITHIIRGKELMIEGEMQKYIWDIFGWKHPELIYVGLVKLSGVEGKLSKSKAQKEVKSGEYSGWDDPRTWSVQSLRRRGFLPETIREFVEEIGLNQNDISVPIDSLYAINRKKLDLKSDRYFFVQDPIKVSIKNLPNLKLRSIGVKIHPEKKKMKEIKLSKDVFVSLKDFDKFKGKEVRLMHFSNINLDKQANFTSLENKSGVPKVQWVAATFSVKTRIKMPNGVYARGFAEKNINHLKKGEIIQFERFGFCRFDHIDFKTREHEFWFAHD